MKSLLSLQLLALPLTCAQLAFSLNTFVTNWFLARASAEAFHAALPGSMLAVAVSATPSSAGGALLQVPAMASVVAAAAAGAAIKLALF